MRIPASIRLILFALVMVVLIGGASFPQIGIAESFGPPALPVYEQPLCPAEGYICVPGYSAYDYDHGAYYLVPGTWVHAPEVGYVWTPRYWTSNGAASAS